jgi:hypothetical protein
VRLRTVDGSVCRSGYRLVMSRSLVQIADELYALAPEQFTAARDAAAKAARDDGDRDLAATVKQFRRPSSGAWLVNQLARTDKLDELLDLGVALREAQDALDGAELRAMSAQRRQVIRSLSTTAADLTGKKIADAAQREFEATLDAALADDAAANAVRTGRLMRSLTSTGLEPVDLTDAVAVPGDAPPVRRPAAKKKAPAAQVKKAAAAAQKKHEAAVAAAEKVLSQAQRDLDDREEQAANAAQDATTARKRTADLEAQLESARAAQGDADQARRDTAAALKSATRARDAAQRAVDTAKKRSSRE